MIAVVWDAALGHYDLAYDGGLVDDDTLRTPVLVSLFSDGLAPRHSGLVGADRKGWWAWSASEPEGDWGSRIWLLLREPLTALSAALLREYAEQALAWMIVRKMASAVAATTKQVSRESLELAIVITRGDGSEWAVAFKLTADGIEESSGIQGP